MLINVPKDLGKPQAVMAGIYKVVVTGVKVERAKNSDNMLIKPELTIQTQTDADGQKIMGRKLFDNWTVAAASLSIWNNHYKALVGHDLPAGDFELDEFINRVTSDIQAKECLVQVEIEEYEGVARNRIRRYTAIGS